MALKCAPSAIMGVFPFVVRLGIYGFSLCVYSYLDLVDLRLDLPPALQLFAQSNTNAVAAFVGFLLTCLFVSGGGSLRSMASVFATATLALAALWKPTKTDPAHQKLSQLCFLTYAVSTAIYLLIGSRQVDGATDDTVRFKPYEAEIRQLLLKNDPSRLRTVDTLLEKEYRGKGAELYRRLEQEFAQRRSTERPRAEPRPQQALPVRRNAPAPQPAYQAPQPTYQPQEPTRHVPKPAYQAPPPPAYQARVPTSYAYPDVRPRGFGDSNPPSVFGRKAPVFGSTGGFGGFGSGATGMDRRPNGSSSGRYGVEEEMNTEARARSDLVAKAAQQYQDDVVRRQEERVRRLKQSGGGGYPSQW